MAKREWKDLETELPGNSYTSKTEKTKNQEKDPDLIATEILDVSSIDGGEKIEEIDILEKDIKPVVKARKKTNVVGETLKATGSFLITDILWPAVKDTIVEMVKSGIEMIAYGDAKPRKGVRRDGTRSYYDYNRRYRYPDRPSYYEDDRPPFDEPRPVKHSNSPYRYRDYVIPTRFEAETILEQMGDLMEQFGVVTVDDVLQFIGVDTVYTDVEFGWTSLENFREGCVKQVRGGYILNFPKPKRLEF